MGDTIFGIVVVVGVLLFLLISNSRRQKAERSRIGIRVEPRSQPSAVLTLHALEFSDKPDKYEAIEEEDHFFQSVLADRFKGTNDKGFFTTVAGTSHKNENGGKRTTIIRECDEFEVLEGVPHPDNPYDPNAIAICRKDGGQLGFLDRRLAGEVTRDIAKHGPRWTFIFRRPTRHPETNRIVGAVIYVVRFIEVPAAISKDFDDRNNAPSQ